MPFTIINYVWVEGMCQFVWHIIVAIPPLIPFWQSPVWQQGCLLQRSWLVDLCSHCRSTKACSNCMLPGSLLPLGKNLWSKREYGQRQNITEFSCKWKKWSMDELVRKENYSEDTTLPLKVVTAQVFHNHNCNFFIYNIWFDLIWF